MKAITWLLASLLLLPAAAAQQVPFDQELPIEEAPAVRRYTVEVVIFTYAEDVAVGSEIFPADKPVIPAEELFLEGAEVIIGDAAAEPAAVDTRPEDEFEEDTDREQDTIDTVLLIDDEFSMQRIIEKLELLDAYEPIMHLGWTQAPLPRDESQPLELAYFDQPPD